MTEQVKRRWKFPEEPPPWVKWLASIGGLALLALKFVKELGRP